MNNTSTFFSTYFSDYYKYFAYCKINLFKWKIISHWFWDSSFFFLKFRCDYVFWRHHLLYDMLRNVFCSSIFESYTKIQNICTTLLSLELKFIEISIIQIINCDWRVHSLWRRGRILCIQKYTCHAFKSLTISYLGYNFWKEKKNSIIFSQISRYLEYFEAMLL